MTKSEGLRGTWTVNNSVSKMGTSLPPDVIPIKNTPYSPVIDKVINSAAEEIALAFWFQAGKKAAGAFGEAGKNPFPKCGLSPFGEQCRAFWMDGFNEATARLTQPEPLTPEPEPKPPARKRSSGERPHKPPQKPRPSKTESRNNDTQRSQPARGRKVGKHGKQQTRAAGRERGKRRQQRPER